ncbi:MAG: hypothetical protein MZV70_00955 [Desulfobacterales bacterium]|nr:hypothetical protein [Desulfobacterales bacterium]
MERKGKVVSTMIKGIRSLFQELGSHADRGQGDSQKPPGGDRHPAGRLHGDDRLRCRHHCSGIKARRTRCPSSPSTGTASCPVTTP